MHVDRALSLAKVEQLKFYSYLMIMIHDAAGLGL